MTLREKRCVFSLMLARLVVFANEQGYEVAIDQVKRTVAEANANAARGVGIKNSVHLLGLAADLLLYKDGKYLSASEDHAQLGMKWETMHPLARWGGRFSKPDGGHYSFEHDGRK